MDNPFENNQEDLQDLMDKYGVTYLAMFGSRVRGDNSPGSDLDILYDYKNPLDLFELSRLHEQLQDLVTVKIDLVSKRGVSKYLRRYIKPDLKVIYEAV